MFDKALDLRIRFFILKLRNKSKGIFLEYLPHEESYQKRPLWHMHTFGTFDVLHCKYNVGSHGAFGFVQLSKYFEVASRKLEFI